MARGRVRHTRADRRNEFNGPHRKHPRESHKFTPWSKVSKIRKMGLDLLSLSAQTIERLAMVRLDEEIAGFDEGAPPKTFVFWILRASGHRGLHNAAWGARHSVLLPTLHNVARLGDAEWCGVMVEGGADVDAEDDYGWTALGVASDFGHTDTTRLLVQLGANADAANDEGATGA